MENERCVAAVFLAGTDTMRVFFEWVNLIVWNVSNDARLFSHLSIRLARLRPAMGPILPYIPWPTILDPKAFSFWSKRRLRIVEIALIHTYYKQKRMGKISVLCRWFHRTHDMQWSSIGLKNGKPGWQDILRISRTIASGYRKFSAFTPRRTSTSSLQRWMIWYHGYWQPIGVDGNASWRWASLSFPLTIYVIKWPFLF